MESQSFLALIEQRLAALEARLETIADRQLTAEVKRIVDIARVDLPFALVKARYVLEIIVRDIYRRELQQAKPKPLFDMIEALCRCEGLFSKKITTDINYIRINGNLIVHAQDEQVTVTDGEVEPILLMTANLVEWYLFSYLPARDGVRMPIESAAPPPPNPYRGLLAFREEDASNYFGREDEAVEVLAAVQRQALVTVVGPSGSGKSSLAFAGVAAPLRAEGSWRIAVCRPKGRPFYELAQALVGLWRTDSTERLTETAALAKALAEGQVELADAVRPALTDGAERLLLVLDQFEELYTLVADPAVSQRFVDLLLRTLEHVTPPAGSGARPTVCLLLTLRADFLGQALAHRGLATALDRHPKKLLGPVSEAPRLRTIIEQPARRAGVALEPLLAERILRDLGRLATIGEDRAPSLPLLEFALSELWQRQVERRLTHVAYEELGGIAQALSRHADAVYARLDAAERERMHHLMVQMVRPGKGTEDTRQVATRAQVRPENWSLVARLANEHLVVTGHDEQSGEDTVELVHEALIGHWQPLRDWLQEARAFRLWQEGLRQALAEWVHTGQDDRALLAGVRLVEAQERRGAEWERLAAQEIAYIEASLARRAAEQAERKRRLTLAFSALVLVLVVVSGLGVYSYFKAVDAEQKAEEAVRKEKDAKHNLGNMFLAKAERSLSDRDFNAARLYAYHALARLDPQRDGPERATGVILANPVFPSTFVSVSGADHDDAVTDVIFSPDRRTLASYSKDNSIRLWDAATGKVKAVLTGHTQPVSGLAFSPDGKTLASGSLSGIIWLWDVATGKDRAVLGGHTAGVSSLSFSPDGQSLASGSWDETIRLWDAATGKEKAVLVGYEGGVGSLLFSPDGQTLASECRGRSVRLWDVMTGKEKGVLAGHTDSVFSLSFSPDGQTLASGSEDKTIRLWEAATGKEIAVLAGHADSVYSLSYSPDGQTLASGSADKTIRLWEAATGKEKAVLVGHRASVRDAIFSADGRTLASGAADGTVRLWEVATGKQQAVLEGWDLVEHVNYWPDGQTLAAWFGDMTIRLCDVATGKVKVLVAHGVRSASYSPDGKSLASGFEDSTIRLWEVETGSIKAVLAGHTGSIESVAFSPNGKTLASGSHDNSIRLWEVETGNVKAVLTGHTDSVESVIFSPDGQILASGSMDKTIRLWDIATGKERSVLEGHANSVISVSFSPDGQTLATASPEGTIRLWDISTGKVKAVLAEHTDSVSSVSFSPDRQTLASVGDQTIRLWEAATGKPKAVLMGVSNENEWGESATYGAYLVFSPDGQTLALGSRDKSIRLWEMATGKLKAVLAGHADSIISISFSPDGQTLATASFDDIAKPFDNRIVPVESL